MRAEPAVGLSLSQRRRYLRRERRRRAVREWGAPTLVGFAGFCLAAVTAITLVAR